MNRDIDLDPVSAITTGAVGEPGERVFYLQAGQEDFVVTLLVEKQQVAVLATQLDQLLERLGEADEEDDADRAPELVEPVEPVFRVGPMALGYDEDRDLVLLQCEELVAEEEVDGEAEPATVRLWATREQMRALARRGEEVVGAGRPTCSMCGEPLEPGGHFCPPSNGHKQVDSLG
jgi:uncharacterized repeat protein (TIGR03847 family)